MALFNSMAHASIGRSHNGATLPKAASRSNGPRAGISFCLRHAPRPGGLFHWRCSLHVLDIDTGICETLQLHESRVQLLSGPRNACRLLFVLHHVCLRLVRCSSSDHEWADIHCSAGTYGWYILTLRLRCRSTVSMQILQQQIHIRLGLETFCSAVSSPVTPWSFSILTHEKATLLNASSSVLVHTDRVRPPHLEWPTLCMSSHGKAPAPALWSAFRFYASNSNVKPTMLLDNYQFQNIDRKNLMFIAN